MYFKPIRSMGVDRCKGFIDWAKGQIEIFAEIFRKQVFSSDADQQTIDEALKIAHSQSRKVGLSATP